MAEPTGKTGDAGTGNPGTQTTPPSTTPAFESFEAFYKAQPENIRGLIDGEVAGLKSALERVKEERTQFKGQISELQKAAEGAPELKQQLDKVQADLSSQARKSRFYEQEFAGRFRNPVSAYATASSIDGAMNDDGTLRDPKAFEEKFPELFRTPEKPPRHDPGRGTTPAETAAQSPAQGMDAAIRAATGRGEPVGA